MTQELEIAGGLKPGDVLGDKYRVERILGTGGMGVVLAAHHLQLDTKVALKFLHPAMLASDEAIARFNREARAAARITSEHVARVLDVGAMPNGEPFVVMELLEGGDLDAWVKQKGPLGVEQAVEFVLQGCVALAEAHTLGIVHRDLKPSNLFCVRGADGQLAIKVLDFGISKDARAVGTGAGVTRTNAGAIGSPAYMSPEQMVSPKSVDARTDIWALGVILFELLAGISPFAGDTLPETCVKIATRAPPPLRAVRPDVPPELERVLLVCLEKNADARWRSIVDLASALTPFAPTKGRALLERIARIAHVAVPSALPMPQAAPMPHLAPMPHFAPMHSAVPMPQVTPMHGAMPGTYPHPSAPPLGAATMAPVGMRRRSSSGGAVIGVTLAIVGVLFVVTAAAGVFVLRVRGRAFGLVASGADASPALSVAPDLPPSPVDAPAATVAASPAAPSASVAPTAVPTVGVAKRPPARRPAPTPSASVAPAPDCQPPFYFNAQGDRIFKKECLQ